MAKKKKEAGKNSKDNSDSKVYAFLATFLSVIGWVIAVIAKKDDDYVKYYAKQGIVILVIAIIAGIINSILHWVPIVGWIIAWAISATVTIIWVISWIYALSGEKKSIPFVSEYAERINF